MTTDQIIDIITQIGPYLIMVITVVSIILKVLKEFRELTVNFKNLKAQVDDKKEFRELNDRLREVINENYELKKTINELLTKIDHIERK